MEVKNTWTDDDFSEMGWHDNYIHSIIFPGNDYTMTFDIDYIFKWELVKEKNLYNFWISPVLLMFKNVSNLKIDIDFENSIGLDIVELKRVNSRPSPNGKLTIQDYIINTDKGLITFESTGFVQKVKKQPIFTSSQWLPRAEL